MKRLVAVVMALVIITSLLGCGGGGGGYSQDVEPSSADAFFDYSNEELGFAAQFPVEFRNKRISSDIAERDSFSLDSFSPPADYVPDDIVSPRTMVEMYKSDYSDILKKRSSIPDLDESIREQVTDSVKDALQILVWSSRDLNPTIEVIDIDGYPAATTVVPATDSEGTKWCYATVVMREDGILELCGTRETEGDAIAARDSFRLLSPGQDESKPESSKPQIPDGAIKWTKAGKHVGETVTVYGPVKGSKYASTSNGEPTYIDIGASYPDSSRVSIVVWGEDRGSFSGSPEDMYLGETIAVTGEVYTYSDACNIEVSDPSQIRIVE
jgi:hypothetical protein